VNVQTSDDHGGARAADARRRVFLGPYSPVAAGDYVAGPSHCLPTNTTARFSSGISVYEFLKRGSVVRYAPEGLANDADAIVALGERGAPRRARGERGGQAEGIKGIRERGIKGARRREHLLPRSLDPSFPCPFPGYNPPMAPRFVRPNVREMHGYEPGEQPGAGERVVKLNTNENPFAPSPKVVQAIQNVEPEMLRRYPNATADLFRDAAAELLGLSRDWIIAATAPTTSSPSPRARSSRPAARSPTPTRPTRSTRSSPASKTRARSAVPWEADYALPIDALVETKADAIYLANPTRPPAPSFRR
jgi:hypothetical protein